MPFIFLFFFEQNWQNGHFWPPYFKNSPRKNFWTKKSPFFEILLNGWLSAGWFNFGEKRRSLRKKSQRLLKIWRWLLKIWRAYRNAKRSKIGAKNVHKSGVSVQIFAFCGPIFHRATPPQGPKSPIFHSRMLRRRELNFLWNILTNAGN